MKNSLTTSQLLMVIAEDNEISRNILAHIVEKWNTFDAKICSDGLEAWHQVEKSDPRPCILMLDWNMPNMNGKAVCHQVRRTKRNHYIIILSGENSPTTLDEILDSGADDYVRKGCHEQELLLRVRCAQTIIGLREELALAQAREQQRNLIPAWFGKIMKRKNIFSMLNSKA